MHKFPPLLLADTRLSGSPFPKKQHIPPRDGTDVLIFHDFSRRGMTSATAGAMTRSKLSLPKWALRCFAVMRVLLPRWNRYCGGWAHRFPASRHGGIRRHRDPCGGADQQRRSSWRLPSGRSASEFQIIPTNSNPLLWIIQKGISLCKKETRQHTLLPFANNRIVLR